MSATIGTRAARTISFSAAVLGRRAGHADDVGPGILAAADLVDRRARVLGRRVGHGLHADRRVSAHGDGADHDLPRRAPLDIAPGTDGDMRRAYKRFGAAGKPAAQIVAPYPGVLTGLTGTRSGAAMAKLARLPADERARSCRTRVRRIAALRTRYLAFLSYSHQDKELADWLHRELEEFRVPHRLPGS